MHASRNGIRLTSCWLLLAAVSLLSVGCPSGTCLLTVNGRCSWSTCPDGAEFDTQRKACACKSDRVALGGSCLPRQEANKYCGKGSHFENGGCIVNACPKALTVDQETGYCITPQQASQVASNMGVQVGPNQKLGCPPGEQLVVEGQQAACVPVQQTCGRDEQWNGLVCKKVGQCPPGSGWDAARNACAQFATAGDKKEYTVDLAAWMRTAYGADRGDGTAAFCSPLNKHPLAFGVGAGKSLKLRIAVQVQAANGAVSNAVVVASAVVDSSSQAVPAKGATEVQTAAQAILGSLIAGGGKSEMPSATTTVTCTIVNSSKPTAVTVTGGA
jgi:hypothetical protein